MGKEKRTFEKPILPACRVEQHYMGVGQGRAASAGAGQARDSTVMECPATKLTEKKPWSPTTSMLPLRLLPRAFDTALQRDG